MFKRSQRHTRDHVGKPSKVAKRSFREDCSQRIREELLARMGNSPGTSPSLGGQSPALNSTIISLLVGPDQRLFAAHEEVLSRSPWFAEACRAQYFSSPGERSISLPEEEPEIIAAVLEYLYRGDYSPCLVYDKKRDMYLLEDVTPPTADPSLTPRSVASVASSPLSKKPAGFRDLTTVYHHGVGDYLLRDTVVYCTALRLGLPDLQRLALRKQGLHVNIEMGIILRSARFAYANTSESDTKLRAHYLALIIRSRKAFKHSTSLQMEMHKGGTKMFFDLFVTMCHHIDGLKENGSGRSMKLDM